MPGATAPLVDALNKLQLAQTLLERLLLRASGKEAQRLASVLDALRVASALIRDRLN